MAFRLMIWKKWLLRTDNFINSVCPVPFRLNQNVSRLSCVAEVTPKVIHTVVNSLPCT